MQAVSFPDGAPPDYFSAYEQARQGDEGARRYADAWLEAAEARDRIRELLEHSEPTVVDRDGNGRAAVCQVEFPDCETGELIQLQVDGRMVREDWIADPRATATAMKKCGSGGGVHRSHDGKMGGHSYGCGASVCPVCARAKAAVKSAKWLRPIVRLHENLGCQVAHVTLTQPRIEEACHDVALTQRERDTRGVVVGAEGAELRRSVPGEQLGSALKRLRDAWKLLRDGRGSRDWWNRSTVGYFTGAEWTGMNQRTGALRWHAHLHVLVVLEPGQDAESWSEQLVGRWCEVVQDAHPYAQCVRQVGGDEGIERALREVLKYPFKAGSLTAAQILDSLATTKGLRPHQAGGGFHGNGVLGRVVNDLVDGIHGPAVYGSLRGFWKHAADEIAAGLVEWRRMQPRVAMWDAGIPAVMDITEEGEPDMWGSETRVGDRLIDDHLWRLLRLGDLERLASEKAVKRIAYLTDGFLVDEELLCMATLLGQVRTWKGVEQYAPE